MSVTYANALTKRSGGSFVCCTRIEGLLKQQISPDVGYLFLSKKNTLDLQAFLKLREFIKKNKIDLIQAHSSSWFLAMMVKLSLPGLKLVWHDHYGKSLDTRRTGVLKPASLFFDGIISVNAALKEWAERNLNAREVRFFRNFIPDAPNKVSFQISINGEQDAFKIICLANLRPQKDHINLLQAFETVEKEYPQVSLHLLGKDKGDKYSNELKTFVKRNGLESKVFFYGEKPNVQELLLQADLGVLSSSSEGLPLALLEYGRVGLPVVCTAVGHCPKIIGNFGLVVPPSDPIAFSKAILNYIENPTKREAAAEKLNKKILEEYSDRIILPQVENFFRKILAD